MLRKPVLLVVEGMEDASRIEQVLPAGLQSRLEIVQAGGVAGVLAVCRTLAGGTRPFLAVRDRDLLSDQEVMALGHTDPDLFVWPGRCLESDLIDPVFLAEAVRAIDAQIEEALVREHLRALAEQQREEIIADIVADRLRRLVRVEQPNPRGKLPADVDPRNPIAPGVLLQVRLRDRVDVAQSRVDAFEREWRKVSEDLQGRFEADHLVLMDGKRALAQLGPKINPIHGNDRLERYLLRRISEGSVPPGFAALFDRLTRLAGTT